MARIPPIALLASLVITGCADHHEAHACSGLHAYFQTEWVHNGVAGESMCNRPASGIYRNDPPIPASEVHFGGEQERPGLPFCGVSAIFMNIPLVTGESGTVSNDRDGYGDGWDPVVYVGLRTAPTLERCEAGGADFATVTGGTWEVLQGGEEGELVEIVLRDITFAPYEGHAFEYERFRWRGILGPT